MSKRRDEQILWDPTLISFSSLFHDANSSHNQVNLSLHASYFCEIPGRLFDPWAHVQGHAHQPRSLSSWSVVKELKGGRLTCNQRILSLWISHDAAACTAALHFALAALPASRLSLCSTILKVQVWAAQEGYTWKEKVLWSFIQEPDSRCYWPGKPAVWCVCVLETVCFSKTHGAALL